MHVYDVKESSAIGVRIFLLYPTTQVIVGLPIRLTMFTGNIRVNVCDTCTLSTSRVVPIYKSIYIQLTLLAGIELSKRA